MKITKKQHQALLDTDLNLEKIAKPYLTNSEFEALEIDSFSQQAKIAHMVSFNYFKPTLETSKPIISKDNIDYLNNFDQIEKDNVTLRSDYVLLGVNAGLEGVDKDFRPFEMFQIQSKPYIGKYENVLKEYNHDAIFEKYLEGVYATDMVKGMATGNAGQLNARFNEIAKKLNINPKTFMKKISMFFGQILENELTLLGNNTKVLIVMGKRKDQHNHLVNKMLRISGLDKKYQVINIYHYSAQSLTNKDMADQLINELQKIK